MGGLILDHCRNPFPGLEPCRGGDSWACPVACVREGFCGWNSCNAGGPAGQVNTGDSWNGCVLALGLICALACFVQVLTLFLGQLLIKASGLVDAIFALLTPLAAPSLTSAAPLPMSVPGQASLCGRWAGLPPPYRVHGQLDPSPYRRLLLVAE